MDQFGQPHHHHDSFNIPPLTNPPPQYFGGNDNNDSPTVPNFDFADGDGQDNDGGHDESNDAKRRRIARVCTCPPPIPWLMALTMVAGVRYVPKEEDKVRREDASMLPLSQLQNRMHFHSG